MQNSYVLSGGDAALNRLKVVDAVHGPDTNRFIRSAGSLFGRQILEVGSGAGLISARLAEMAGAAGSVVGIDIRSDQVETASRLHADLHNLRFTEGSAESLPMEDGSFDVVFCRLTLMHVPDAPRALGEFRRVLRDGGTLLVEDGDFTTPYIDPPLPAFSRAMERYRTVGEMRGQDFLIGRHLHRMVRKAGFTVQRAQLVQPLFLEGPERDLPAWTLEECADAVEAAGICTRQEIEEDIAAIRRHVEKGAAVGMVRMMQVQAVK